MKPDPQFLKFPAYLLNDLEGFLFIYPRKFPKVVSEYERAAKKFGTDPIGFRKLGDLHRNELFVGFAAIKKDLDAGNDDDLSFLIEIDQRFHRLNCFRFWIINYLFPDGPLHEFFIERIRYFSRRLTEEDEDLDVEDYENKISRIQRNLLQGVYADLYLQNALNGVKIMDLLRLTKRDWLIITINDLLRDGSKANRKIFKLLDPLIEEAYRKRSRFGKELAECLHIMMEQAKLRGSRLPIYNVLIHSIEFEKENKMLQIRHDGMTDEIEGLFKLARERFSKREVNELSISYHMAQNFARYKDVMGDIDDVLLPIWFGLLSKVEALLKQDKEIPNSAVGVGGMFYKYGWYLPDELKIKVFSPDPRPFSLENL